MKNKNKFYPQIVDKKVKKFKQSNDIRGKL